MKKRVVSLILIIAIIAGSVCTAAAAGGLGNFTQKNTFTKRTFTDVPQSEWYYSDVKRVYELGLVEDDEYDTLAGFIIAKHGGIPLEGEEINVGDYMIKILRREQSRLELVSLQRLQNR